MNSLAVIGALTCALITPAFADDAGKAAVLRDLWRDVPQRLQPSEANALAVRATRVQRPAQVIVNSPTPFDVNQIGHN
jgi:hypothetical protein